ncbi:uncharacterized protein LOC112566396 [Pomacea canaliculata]|uniref:uncharacterized protein LOC112566396 n=1 Tax=Pomacea canaliculata TaxID=400727 RepID=UPI000D73A415|nr:uncharacterized protein LOC112566396 [Pomacea canaliculata]
MAVSKNVQTSMWLLYRVITSSSSIGFKEDAICSSFSNLELKGGEFADAAQGITVPEELSKAFINDVGCLAGHINDIKELNAEIDNDSLTKTQALGIVVKVLSSLQTIIESGNSFSFKLAQAFATSETTTPAATESSDENSKRALERLLRTLQNNPDLLNRRSPK